MSSEERKKILQMVADGKISADEAATLMRALDESVEEEIVPVGEASGMGGERSDAPEFDQVRRRANRFSNITLAQANISAYLMKPVVEEDLLPAIALALTHPLNVFRVAVELVGLCTDISAQYGQQQRRCGNRDQTRDERECAYADRDQRLPEGVLWCHGCRVLVEPVRKEVLRA